MSQRRSPEHIRAQREGKEIDQYVCFFCQRQFKGNHGHHIMLYSEGGRSVSSEYDNALSGLP